MGDAGVRTGLSEALPLLGGATSDTGTDGCLPHPANDKMNKTAKSVESEARDSSLRLLCLGGILFLHVLSVSLSSPTDSAAERLVRISNSTRLPRDLLRTDCRVGSIPRRNPRNPRGPEPADLRFLLDLWSSQLLTLVLS